MAEKELMPIDRVIYDVMPSFQRIAESRKKVRWAEESQYALQAVKSNPKLLKCDVTTIQDAIINVASVGLSLNPASGHCYLVPEYNKQAKVVACQLRVSFKGLIKLATDSGSISWVKADVVKEKDTFEHRGFNEIPLHHMKPFEDRGATVGAYCVAKTTAGEILVDVISAEQLSRIKGSAKTQFVWDNWPDEMAKKAIIKRAAKQWPPGPHARQLDEAIAVINKSEGTDFEEFEQLEKTAAYISKAIKDDDSLAIGEAWDECSQREREQLWRAKTKGGFFSQAEKEDIRRLQSKYRDETMTEEEKQAAEERKESNEKYIEGLNPQKTEKTEADEQN